MQTDTLIVGGGLSGASLASQLAAQGRDFLLVEARDRLGGRILSTAVDDAYFDLGPAWFWPGQPRMAALVDALGLTRFDQFADGALTYEDERGQVQRGRGFASMEGSYRLKGGLGSLIDALSKTFEAKRVLLKTPIVKIACKDHGVEATTADGKQIEAQHCVLALPPRLASNLTFEPVLSESALQAMRGIATWMAGQAKAVAVYDRPFWREKGLSGDAMSRRGPLAEIHDASPAEGGPFALFGFVGVPPQARGDAQALKAQITAQLGRLFGPDAREPKDLLVKDWAYDAHSSMALDLQPLYAHPSYGLPHILRDVWDGRLLFSGTEVAPQFGGYLEGALEAAANTLTQLSKEEV
ncbi:MAG: FAD-dependent oxidoreductase [Pseudomonadota bacterium]